MQTAIRHFQVGDWESLAELEIAEIAQGRNRAALAVFAAAGVQQLGDINRLRELCSSALAWGAGKATLAQVLIQGIHNTLGKAAGLANEFQLAQEQFAHALPVTSSEPSNEEGFKVRMAHQCPHLVGNNEQQHAHPMPVPKISGNKTILTLWLQLNGESTAIEFRAATSGWVSRRGRFLEYDLPNDQPGYLVTNETGNFDEPPRCAQFQLTAGTTHEISGHVAVDGSERPVIWLFQYAGGRKVASNSFKTTLGDFRALLRTEQKIEKCAFGIRLGGAGRLLMEETYLTVRSSPEIALEAALDEKIAKLDRKLAAQLDQQNKSVVQLEHYLRLHSYLSSAFALPEMRAWRVSPDFAGVLVRLLTASRYDAIVEFGSGSSTVIIAMALAKLQAKNSEDVDQPIFVSFDHLEQFYLQTAKELEIAQVDSRVQLKFTPLTDYRTPSGTSFQFYDCIGELQQLKNHLNLSKPKLLVVVDGPPAATGPKARYPALPVLKQVFAPGAQMDLILDDYIRDDEKDIVAEWEKLLRDSESRVTKEEFLKLEKQACLLRITSDS